MRALGPQAVTSFLSFVEEAQGPHAAKGVQLGLKGQEASTGSTNKACVVQTARAHRLGKLVEHLVPAVLGRDPAFVPTFLWNYRTLATSQQVLDLLLTRYGCIFPYAEEDGGPVDQQKKAIISILGMWLDQYPEDFFQPPEFPCLVMLLAYLDLNFPGSDLERQAQLLLSELERREPAEAEAEEPAPEQEQKRPQEATPPPVASPEPEQAPAQPSLTSKRQKSHLQLLRGLWSPVLGRSVAAATAERASP
ncbi:ral guanine nucleotide dissociation stimulator-like [Eptesicus fuscus]|uniref:ral guanine nucleotide dissociation stimulator-like n=1 Tax=Eptesicus fuscus TaxID=29078 RepID=UPI0024040BC5|nr:ral guanine nucleotide dissociation stimulator-like [Eptesicus fuscus]